MRRCGRVAWSFLALIVLLPALGPTPASAQSLDDGELLNLFFDCQAPNCGDADYFRRELPFVNWVLDREVADVHVLVTSQQTGGGGQAFALTFIGLRAFEGQDHELNVNTSGDATDDEERSELAHRTRLGLVQYAQETSAASRLQVTFATPTAEAGGTGGETVAAADDPWNFWVFRLSANAFLNGQSTFSNSNLFTRVGASRTTEGWKHDISFNFSQNVQKFDIPQSDGSVETIEETREDWGARVLSVKSLGEHWALGVRADVGSSTFLNQALRGSFKPGLEVNLFPYSESSRRSLTLQYLAGPVYFEYNDTTLFGHTEETRGQQSLTARLDLVQPWGRWSTSVTGQQYLHDLGKYSVTIFGSFNVRLFKGFSVRMSGNYSWIRDQIFLPAEGATSEQILLFQRQLETNFRYFTSIGFEYRFGSIFNNVVNPRFGSEPQFF